MVLLIIFKQSGKPQICLDASTKDKPHQYSLCQMLSYKKDWQSRNSAAWKKLAVLSVHVLLMARIGRRTALQVWNCFRSIPKSNKSKGGGGVGGERLVYLSRQSWITTHISWCGILVYKGIASEETHKALGEQLNPLARLAWREPWIYWHVPGVRWFCTSQVRGGHQGRDPFLGFL